MTKFGNPQLARRAAFHVNGAATCRGPSRVTFGTLRVADHAVAFHGGERGRPERAYKVMEHRSLMQQAPTFSTMYEHDVVLRVRYGETDRMGYVYYGNYAEYLEVARVEMLRSLGISYRELEDGGVMLPVRELRITYHKPAFYDDVITVRTQLRAMPAVRIVFQYTLLNAAGAVLSEAETTLVFIDRTSGKPRSAPPLLVERLRSYFS